MKISPQFHSENKPCWRARRSSFAASDLFYASLLLEFRCKTNKNVFSHRICGTAIIFYSITSTLYKKIYFSDTCIKKLNHLWSYSRFKHYFPHQKIFSIFKLRISAVPNPLYLLEVRHHWLNSHIALNRSSHKSRSEIYLR